MSNRHIRHLPVLEKDKLVGLISITDLVREIVSQKDITIHEPGKLHSGPGIRLSQVRYGITRRLHPIIGF